ncbi:DUF3558 family protein [Actinophytocola sediminis]
MITNRARLAAGMAALLLLTGCGGESSSADSKTEDSAETTSAVPEIDDPTVAAAALRTVDPCALLDAKNLGDAGTIVPDSTSSAEWGECGVDVDASGKTVELVLRVGDQLIMADDPSGELEGLPLVLDDEDPESCWISVVTSFELSLGITLQVDFPGGDGCTVGRAVLGKVVQAVRTAPPQYQQAPGSVLTADPCAVADKAAVETALGQQMFVEPKSLHECDLWSGDGTSYPQVGVRFFLGLPPDAEDGEPADLGGGVTAIQAQDEDVVISCDVSWRRIETPSEDEAEGYGELVSVMYSDEQESGLDPAVACAKAVAVAKTVVPALG